MDGQQLLSQLQAYISNDVLTLSASNSLNSSSVNTLLSNFFGNTLTVTLSNAPEVNTTYIYFRNCSFNAEAFELYRSQANLLAQLTFEVVSPGDRIELLVELTLPDSYTFSDSFETVKELTNNSLNDLKVTEPRLLLNSRNLPEKLDFTAKLIKNQGLIKPLGWLFEDAIVLRGSIQLTRTEAGNTYPEMLLKTTTSKSPPVMGFEMDVLFQVQSKLITITNSEDSSNQQVQLVINNTIVADFITSKFRLPVVINTRSNQQSSYHVMLDLQRPFPVIGKLSDLSDLTGGTNPSESLSVDTPVGALSFQHVSFTLDAVHKTISDFTISIYLWSMWTSKHEVLVLEGFTMVIVIPYFANPSDFGIIVTANLLIGNTGAAAYVSYPDKVIGAQTTALIDINEFLSTFAEDAKLPGTGDLRIYEFNLTADIGNQTYSLTCNAAGNWSIIPNFVLDEIEFAIDYDGTLALVFGCIFTIAKTELYLQVVKSSDTWTLSGGTYQKQEVSLTDLTADLLSIFQIALPSDLPQFYLLDLELENYETKTGNFTFQANAAYSNNDDPILKKIEGRCVINRKQDTNQQSIWSGEITGIIEVAENQFNVSYDFKESRTLIASWEAESDKTLGIADLCRELLDVDLPDIPADLDLGLNKASFRYNLTNKELVLKANSANYGKAIFIGLKNQQQQWKFLFGFAISKPINLSELPLVGAELSSVQTISVNDLQLLIVSQNLDFSETNTFNKFIPDDFTKLSIPSETNQAADTTIIQKGANISAKLQFGDTAEVLALPISSDSQSTTSPPDTSSNSLPAAPSVAANSFTSDNATWFKIQKNLGSIHFERVGIQYKDAALSFLLDAALSVAGLTLSLEGLSVGSALRKFEPKFNLRGLGIDYKSGPIEIGGAFLKGKITIEGKEYDDYSGTAIIRTEALTLAAIGSYVQLDVGPSMFIYAVLDYPIGGPAFFFVTGLAAGFGYNRLLHVPPVDQIHTFPLVQEAMGEQDTTPNLATELAKLQQYIPPSVGNYFLAIGIRFTSFKMIDSFILVSATFGHRFELDVLGLSTLVLPAPDAAKAGVTPIAEVQLALRATFIPDDGFLGVSAQLTNNSFLLDRKCHLTGGFAFYTWFSGIHEGDFVLTVGGYHPHFSHPSHYPTVPRLGFNWQVTNQLNFKGSAYYALTPSALMAGCSLSANWHDGSLRAWFDAGLNFLISWKPYHYEADFHINVGASYTFHFFGTHHITAHLGAGINIWGPEFAGKAHISWTIISFTISFGASSRNQLTPIPWSQFRQSFLPDNDKVCTINLKAGLINQNTVKDNNHTEQIDSNDFGIVNPKTFCLTTDSVIPLQQAYLGEQEQTALTHGNTTVAFNIGTMQLRNSQITSTQHIKIIYNDTNLTESNINEMFDFQALGKNAPAALWGSRLRPSLQGKQIVANLLTGYEIHAKRPTEAPHTDSIPYKTLQEPTNLVPSVTDAFQWAQLTPFVAQALEDLAARQEINNTFKDSNVVNKRTAIANALFNDISLELNELNANDFLSAPQVK